MSTTNAILTVIGGIVLFGVVGGLTKLENIRYILQKLREQNENE